MVILVEYTNGEGLLGAEWRSSAVVTPYGHGQLSALLAVELTGRTEAVHGRSNTSQYQVPRLRQVAHSATA